MRQLGIRVNPDTAVIHVDGARVQLDELEVTLACYKERGVVSTMNDDQGRPTLADYIEDRTERSHHVGRLDAETEGIILTNDGELAHRLTHLLRGSNLYRSRRGHCPTRLDQCWRKGITLEDGPVKVDRSQSARGWRRKLTRRTLHSGRNRIVRRIMEEVGFPSWISCALIWHYHYRPPRSGRCARSQDPSWAHS